MSDKNFCHNVKKNIDNLYQISKNNLWTWDYDEISDILCFCNQKKGFSEKSINMPIDGDFLTVQINQKGDIEGIVIENFIKLFVPENSEYKVFAENLIKKEKIKNKNKDLAESSAKGFCKMLATDFRYKFAVPAEKCYAPA
jgi:hypothetical protein